MSDLVSSSDTPVSLRICSLKDIDQISRVWHQLQSTTSHSYFISWGWISTWLRCLEKPADVSFVILESDGIPVSCFFLGLTSGIESRLFYKQRGHLNETGFSDFDDIVIEYNGTLGSESAFLEEVVAHTAFSSIEEFRLSALTKSAYESLKIPAYFALLETRTVPSYLVDLNRVRESGQSYLSHLSRNRRGQLRQSLKHYEVKGAVSVSEASSCAEAIAMLGELEKLHQKSWNKKGKEGSFANEFFRTFHNQLIESRFDSGEIQLLKIASPDGPIGFVYNFVYDNKVLHYQSGYNYGASNASRPGLVSHYQAILHNLERGRDIYNFLAGDSQYKRSLSTDCDSLFYAVIARKGWKLKAERVLRAIWSKARR